MHFPKRSLASLILLIVLFGMIPSISFGAGMQTTTAYLSAGTQQTSYQIIQHPLPNGSTEPWAIATDSLGRVWFVEQGSNQLGMLNPSSGNFSEYSIPTPNSTVISVAVDRSGNAWLTELTSNRLGELKNGSSSIIEYQVPGSPYQIGGRTQFQSCGPSGVVPDSSGNVWVICIFSNQLDEFFPNNSTFLNFDLPVYQSGPAGLVFDNKGNFYFTAADADMLGQGIISELKNGTSDGITEFAPINQTYAFTFQKALGPLGPYENSTSSLPTPSGMAISPDGNTLWITEHVDNSFDSYNLQSKSLVRYWTSKTHGAFGYRYSFPNGVAVDSAGNVWISEHYGNKIAEFNPSRDALTEYIVPCCNGTAAGSYTLTLGKNGTVWFVEISGNAIGELRPVPANQSFALSLKPSSLDLGSSSSANISVALSMSGGGNQNATLDVSGISRTGELSGAIAAFNPSTIEFNSGGNETSMLSLSTKGLAPGTYYLTVSARVSPEAVIYSEILKLQVSNYGGIIEYAAAAGIVASVVVVGVIAFKVSRRRSIVSKRKIRSRRK